MQLHKQMMGNLPVPANSKPTASLPKGNRPYIRPHAGKGVSYPKGGGGSGKLGSLS